MHVNFLACYTEIVAFDIISAQEKHRFVCCYRSQQANNPDCAEILTECLSTLCSVSHSCTLVGDFNLPEINWKTFACPASGFCRIIFDFFTANSFNQFVSLPTRGGNTLDLVFCNDNNCITNVKVLSNPILASDHLPVSFSLSNLSVPPGDPSSTLIYDYKNADYVGLGNFLQRQNWDLLFENCASANNIYDVFCDVMYAGVEVYVPKKRVRKSFAFRLPRTLRRLRARRNALYRNRNVDEASRVLYRDCCREWREKVLAYNEKMEAKCINSGNVRRFYKFANSKLKKKQGLAPLRREDGSLTCDDNEKSELLNAFFGSVFTHDNGRHPEFASRVQAGVKFEEIIFSPRKVQKVLKSLPNKLSRSPDSLPSLFLKYIWKNAVTSNNLYACVSVPLSKIFNFCFQMGDLPDVWLTADVVGVFKKGLATEVTNYRPISLTCITCKIMETVIKNEVVDYLLNNELITSHQHGFLSNKSVESQLLECLNYWSKCMKDRKSVDIAYLDFAKAFDSVSHSKLMIKLSGYGISGALKSWICAFLSNRQQRVVVKNSFSEYISVTSGVPQGSVLGPLLFLLYINDITECCGDAVI